MRTWCTAKPLPTLILYGLVGFGCGRILGPSEPLPVDVDLEGPWRGDVEVMQNTCSGDTQHDFQTWNIAQQQATVTIFFSHQEFVGTIEPDGRFSATYKELKRFEPLRFAATISGQLMPDGRLVATQTIDRTSPTPVCRIVKMYLMERFPT